MDLRFLLEQCVRAESPGLGRSARLGPLVFIHRFGSALNPHLRVIASSSTVRSTPPPRRAIFHAATELDVNAIANAQACERRRLLRVFLRRGLLSGDDAQPMAQWAHGGGYSVDALVRIEPADRAGRERLLRYDRRKFPFETAPGTVRLPAHHHLGGSTPQPKGARTTVRSSPFPPKIDD